MLYSNYRKKYIHWSLILWKIFIMNRMETTSVWNFFAFLSYTNEVWVKNFTLGIYGKGKSTPETYFPIETNCSLKWLKLLKCRRRRKDWWNNKSLKKIWGFKSVFFEPHLYSKNAVHTIEFFIQWINPLWTFLVPKTVIKFLNFFLPYLMIFPRSNKAKN